MAERLYRVTGSVSYHLPAGKASGDEVAKAVVDMRRWMREHKNDAEFGTAQPRGRRDTRPADPGDADPCTGPRARRRVLTQHRRDAAAQAGGRPWLTSAPSSPAGITSSSWTATTSDLAAPDPALITAEVIAHGLSHVCRFAGQSRRFYSVAEHAVLVADRLVALGQPPEVVFAGLHHDDSEALIGDVTRPLKALLPGYADLERRLSAVIAEALVLPAIDAEGAAAVKAADDWALACEAHYLLPSQGSTWFCAALYDDDAHAPRTMGQQPADARRRWIDWHKAIEPQVAARMGTAAS